MLLVVNEEPVAPEFELPDEQGRRVALSDFRGQPVVLAFYPGDWEEVSTAQLRCYQHWLPELRRHGAVLLGISTDSPWSHAAFASALGLDYPLLADFRPRGQVARAYGCYEDASETTDRCLLVIDRAGRVCWQYRSPRQVDPGVDGILSALEALHARGPASESGADRAGLARSV
jgi:peroxiredoxin